MKRRPLPFVPLVLAVPFVVGNAYAAPTKAPPPAPAAVPSPESPPSTTAISTENPLSTLGPVAGGMTAEKVRARAATVSFNAKAQASALRAAAARVDAAWSAFLPRLSGSAGYRRLSEFAPPALGTLVIPLVLDNYTLQATIAVPLSDYFLRIAQAYSATVGARDAARQDVAAARAKSGTEGALAFYSWLRARGALVVAKQSLGDQRTHLRDAKNLFDVGTVSKADVLRAETAVAAAELQVERSGNLTDLTAKQLRQALQLADAEPLTTGEDLESALAPIPDTLKALTEEARSKRAELRSLDANIAAAHKQAAVMRGSAWPSLSGYGTGIYANPNQRRFPQTETWFGTWEVGATVNWSPNDFVLGMANGNDGTARALQIEAQRDLARDGIDLEVTQAHQAVKEADFALEATRRQLASASEAYRVAHELFMNGRATSTTLTDSETDLTRARLESLNAHVDARVARVRLSHAVGRDVGPVE